MKLTVINSGSSGNCYLLESDNEILVIELGVTIQKLKQALGFNLNKIVFAIVTHEHGDHSKAVKDAIASGVDVVMSSGTQEALGIESHRIITISHGGKFKRGKFEVLAFEVKHDAREPLGFLIRHPELGTMLFLTDSYYSGFSFPGLTNILVEANYCEQILKDKVDAGLAPKFLRDRVIQSHMSLRTCKELLMANDLSKVNNIVLIHLSDSNSHAARFQKEVEQLTGKKTNIAVAGLVIENFGLDPF